jgi:cytochrome c oxidase assembly protein subunit 15
VEWKPIVGAIPPLNDEKWNAEFDKYKQTYEFLIVNNSMTINEFKTIYWWEWGHRQLGRTIGLIWFFGFLALLFFKRIPALWTSKLVVLGFMGGLQGLIGWWMVSSGLNNQMIDVASYRLAIHLSLAFAIIMLITWLIQLSKRSSVSLMIARREKNVKLANLGSVFILLLFIQIILGALVAGIDAGKSYNDWPLMGGELFPSDYLQYDNFLLNFLDNAATVQFNHRVVGYLTFLVAIFIWLQSRKSPFSKVRFQFNLVLVCVFFQVIIGVITVIYGATLQVAIFHQLMALILFTISVRAHFESSYPTAQTLI